MCTESCFFCWIRPEAHRGGGHWERGRRQVAETCFSYRTYNFSNTNSSPPRHADCEGIDWSREWNHLTLYKQYPDISAEYSLAVTSKCQLKFRALLLCDNFFTMWLVTIQLLTCIKEVFSLRFSQNSDHPDRNSFWFSSLLSANGRIASEIRPLPLPRHILPNSLSSSPVFLNLCETAAQ